MKRILELSIKQWFATILIIYFASALVITIICLLTGQRETISIGKAFLYTGITVSVLGLMGLVQAGGDRTSGYEASQFMKNQEYQRKSIETDKPYRKGISIIIISGILLAVTGYFLMSFLL